MLWLGVMAALIGWVVVKNQGFLVPFLKGAAYGRFGFPHKSRSSLCQPHGGD